MKIVKLMALLTLAVASVGAGVVWFSPIGEPSVATFSELEGDVGRGVYLARTSGCIACHTNSEKGGAPLAGGNEFATNFGTFVAPNLTTDPVYGMGAWTIEEFDVAVRQGVSPDGLSYYPAFPFAFYAKFSDQDIADLWAAFQTVQPVELELPDHNLGFPFNLQRGLNFWRLAFLDLDEFEQETDRSDEWNRGKYLVTGPTHCGACHTPRNFAGARQSAQFLGGSEGLSQNDKSPAITLAALEEAGWNIQDLAYSLKSGIMPDGDVYGGGMEKSVRDSLSFLSEADRQAIAVYLMQE